MKNSTKRTIAAFGAATMLMSGGIVSAMESEVPVAENAQESVEASVLTPSVSHGYLVNSFVVGKSEESNKIVSEDGLTELYKTDEVIVLDANGNKKELSDIAEGNRISFYVDGNKPMTLQYPPCYSPDVIVIEDSEALVMRAIGVFDEDLLDEELSLQLVMDGDEAYYSKTRDIFHGGKALVFYDITTKSIPAQANPIAIVKLNDDLEEEVEESIDLSAVKRIIVGEDTIISHIPVTVNGVSMLPVRSVAEALGYNVEWDDETKTVTVGHAFFKIGEDSYTIGKRMPDVLGQAPVLISLAPLPEGEYALTYVPASFFTEVLGCSLTVEGENAVISEVVAE